MNAVAEPTRNDTPNAAVGPAPDRVWLLINDGETLPNAAFTSEAALRVYNDSMSNKPPVYYEVRLNPTPLLDTPTLESQPEPPPTPTHVVVRMKQDGSYTSDWYIPHPPQPEDRIQIIENREKETLLVIEGPASRVEEVVAKTEKKRQELLEKRLWKRGVIHG